MKMLSPTERNLIEQFYTWGLPRTPGSRVVQSNRWFQVISGDYKSPAFNEVLFSDCEDSEIENKIVATINLYKDVGTDFKWCISPNSQPANTATLLIQHDFLNWQSRMMYARVSEFFLQAPIEGIEVRKVSPSETKAFTELFVQSWKIKPDEISLVSKQLEFDNIHTSASFERFWAFVNGKPAGVASMVRNSKCGYLHATAVLPEFQGQGVYRALIEKRIEVLKAHKVGLAITGAREQTSAPRLEKMGFSTAWQVQMFLKRHQADLR